MTIMLEEGPSRRPVTSMENVPNGSAAHKASDTEIERVELGGAEIPTRQKEARKTPEKPPTDSWGYG